MKFQLAGLAGSILAATIPIILLILARYIRKTARHSISECDQVPRPRSALTNPVLGYLSSISLGIAALLIRPPIAHQLLIKLHPFFQYLAENWPEISRSSMILTIFAALDEFLKLIMIVLVLAFLRRSHSRSLSAYLLAWGFGLMEVQMNIRRLQSVAEISSSFYSGFTLALAHASLSQVATYSLTHVSFSGKGRRLLASTVLVAVAVLWHEIHNEFIVGRQAIAIEIVAFLVVAATSLHGDALSPRASSVQDSRTDR